jgi:hypothetical protein
VILLLRLSDDLRQDWRDLLKGVADFLLRKLALTAPVLAAAKSGVLAERALSKGALPELTLAEPSLLGLLILLQNLRKLLQRGGNLWRSLLEWILKGVLLR